MKTQILSGTATIAFTILSCLWIKAQSADNFQATDWELLDSLPIQGYALAADQLNHTYLALADDQLLKLDPQHREQFRYSDNFLGPVGHIDATNPINILVFYPDFLTITILDRTLNPLGTIDLLGLGYQFVEVAARASAGGVWIYDPVSFTLRNIQKDGRVRAVSNDLSLQFPAGIEPLKLVEFNNQLWLQTRKQGVMVFNLFGGFIRQIPLPEGQESYFPFQLRGRQVVFFTREELYFASTQPPYLYSKLPLPPTDASIQAMVFNESGQLLVLTTSALLFYKRPGE